MRLRPLIPDRDFDRIRNWITDERTHAMWCGSRFAFPLEMEDFTAVLRENGGKNGETPFVATADDGEAVGFFSYFIDTAANAGLLKYVVVDPALRGRGTARAMLRMAADYAFSITGAEEVRLCVFPNNIRALRCYEGAGFTAVRTDPGAFRYGDEAWDRCFMVLRRAGRETRTEGRWTIRYNDLDAAQFVELWESVWSGAPTTEQAALAMENTLFRVSVFDGDRIVAMARMNGDKGLNYYIKDVIVRPEYQGQGIGRLLGEELTGFIRHNGVKGTQIFTELCAMPDKIPFYAQFGFSANEAQRLRKMIPAE